MADLKSLENGQFCIFCTMDHKNIEDKKFLMQGYGLKI